MDSRAQYVVTPWRSSQELLDVRSALYGSDKIKQERAVNKIFTWRTRKPDGLPLLLDSTADIVDVTIQDAKHDLPHNAVRLLYATALSRFITGLADTQIDLIRDRPAWFPSGKTLQLPLHLLEIRHRIVHRHLPSLIELKRAVQDSLDWLWEWYWSQLDYAFGKRPIDHEAEVESIDAIREKLQSILKTYVKERKNEIKSREKVCKAAENAVSTCNLRYGPSSTWMPSTRIQSQLLQLLIDEKMILPADKKFGSNMSGAFLIWSPFLLAISTASPPIVSLQALLARFLDAMDKLSSETTIHVSMYPVLEGLYDWIAYILLSDEWDTARESQTEGMIEDTLATCFSNPTHWNIKLAEKLVGNENVRNREQWSAVLVAARNEDGGDDVNEHAATQMDVDIELNDEKPEKEAEGEAKQKIRGPRKALGLWTPRPIGWVPEGWEDDE